MIRVVVADDHALVRGGFQMILEAQPDIEVTGVSDEHGKLRVGPRAERLSLGEKVWLIPGHCDPTVNLHDWYVGIRNGRVEALWPIDARGASI